MNIYFKNIRIVNPAQDIDDRFNLWVKDGVINHLSKDEANLDTETEVVDNHSLVAAPGFFDMHVHLREPGQEYKEDIETGTNAAKNGGFTGLVCMPNTDPAIDNNIVAEYIRSKAADKLTDVYLSAALTEKREGKQLTPMIELDENGVVIFTDDGSSINDANILRRIFDYAASRDLLVSQHCEEHSLTHNYAMNEGYWSDKLGLKGYPTVAEEIALSRDIMLSEYCGNRRYHASHVSTKGAVRIIRDAKERGLRVSAEVTPHHFVLTDNLLESYDTNLKMNPPLRSQEDVDAIIEGIKDGTIDCIASDHAPHALHEKDVEYEIAPNGIIGLETSIGLTLTHLYHKNHIDLNKVVNILSVNPRKILGLDEVVISEGQNANLTIFDIDKEWQVDKNKFMSKSTNSPFDCNNLKGKPVYAINKNQMHKCEL